MWFWYFMFVSNLLTPLLMIVMGHIMWKHSPQNINTIFGYRTKRSMKNMDTWKFAHEYCGKLWWKLGWIMLIPTIIAQLPFYHSNEDIVGTVGAIICSIQIVVLFMSIYPTEVALKRTFNDDGSMKITKENENEQSIY